MTSHKRMAALRYACAAMLALTIGFSQQGAPSPAAEKKVLNTVKQKLADGKQVFSHTISRADPEAYCLEAPHYDFTLFEMQHSTLSFADVEKMIGACPHAGAMPFVRVPDAFESTIQKATDIGAIGLIVPTVDDAAEAQEAARWARFPPVARRSSGGGQHSRIWAGADRKTINDNMMIIVMIETVEGVNNAYEIAKTPGIDVVITGNNDLSAFSGFQQSDPRYQALLEKVRDATLKAGKIFGTASNAYASGNPVSKDARLFQNGPSNDGWVRPGGAGRGGRGGRGRGAAADPAAAGQPATPAPKP